MFLGSEYFKNVLEGNIVSKKDAIVELENQIESLEDMNKNKLE